MYFFDCLIWTFNLPDFQGRYLKQGTSGTYGSESLPNITGNVGYYSDTNKSSGAFYREGSGGSGFNAVAYSHMTKFSAARSSTVYQDGAKVNPDNAEILYCIKY